MKVQKEIEVRAGELKSDKFKYPYGTWKNKNDYFNGWIDALDWVLDKGGE